MTRIYTTTIIHKPIDQLFQFVTTAGNWLQWHPSSLGVTGAVDHSAGVGEQITEQFLVAGRRGEAVWTVTESQPPRRWVIEGKVGTGGGGTITYTLTEQADGTRFEREFVYHFHSLLPRLIDPFLVRPRIDAESAEALRRLKAILEA